MVDLAPKYKRYAIYFAPREGSTLADFGANWLDVSHFVTKPRRYGFHATLKAPMRLAEGVDFKKLCEQVDILAQKRAPVSLGFLKLSQLSDFLALVPERSKVHGLNKLAWKCVRFLDPLRAPMTHQQIAKRKDLKHLERENFDQWGYPYVGNQFRFHMTLTNGLSKLELVQARSQLDDCIGNSLIEPVTIDSLCIFGDPGKDGQFELLERFEMRGALGKTK
ncbi:MAG: phosphonate metabolism protein [Hyphomicrobiales bacterium]|nr:MAG: phosphonate metabolism protein [Hyphomicrobiales bacterium]